MTVTTFTRSTPIGAADSSTAATATLVNESGGECIGIGWMDADTTGTVTTENAFQIVDVPVNAGRLIRIEVEGTYQATGPTGLQILIIEDSTTLRRREDGVSDSTPKAFHATAYSLSPSAGDHTYTLAYGISGPGGETVLILAAATSECTMVVTDAGPDPTV